MNKSMSQNHSQIILTGKSYRNFIEALDSPVSRISYKNSLSLYMKFRNKDICDSLLDENIEIIQQCLIDYIIYLKNELQIASSTIKTRIAAVQKFYDCNNIDLKWKKIKSYIGKVKTKRNNGRKDRPYTHLEIQKMLEKANERDRVIILLMTSTGMRVGALPSLKIRNLQRVENYQIYKITVYENEDEEYITYCTPECARAIDSYLEYRERHGERLCRVASIDSSISDKKEKLDYDKEKYKETILDAAETVLGYFGFDRSIYGNKKNISKRKWRWFEELRQERERDINIEMSENLHHHNTRNQ